VGILVSFTFLLHNIWIVYIYLELPKRVETSMKIRCLIKKDGDLYIAMSLEFGLAAQADSVEEAQEKLHQQIEEYIQEANEEDVIYREKLLARKGNFSLFILYYFAYGLSKLSIKFRNFRDFIDSAPRSMHHA